MAQGAKKPDKDVFLKPPEVIERWHGTVAHKTLQNWRSIKGAGPKFVRRGNHVFYRLDWIKEFEVQRGWHFGHESTKTYGCQGPAVAS